MAQTYDSLWGPSLGPMAQKQLFPTDDASA